MTTLKQIDEFLALKRIAVVGVSRDPKDFTHAMWQEFRQRRVDAVPVNPNAGELDGQRCYARLQDIDPPVQGVVIMTAAKLAPQIVRDCAEVGVKSVWLYGGMAPGPATKETLAACDAVGIDPIAGLCPYMFLPNAGAMHAPHKWIKKVLRTYPKPA